MITGDHHTASRIAVDLVLLTSISGYRSRLQRMSDKERRPGRFSQHLRLEFSRNTNLCIVQALQRREICKHDR
ncbi:hypothetical protein [Cylindrospermopsis raciborskii]|uniref:hypothetical protein n=1 Tax=Cylindrospermopsis raciborskii TaxID=77022 RepID=UPI002ED83077